MSLLEDLRFAFRMMAKRPWITAMIVAVLAVGIGANTAIFTLFNAVLVRGLPFPEGERVFFMEERNLQRNQRSMNVSYPDMQDWREQATQFEGIAGMVYTAFNLSDETTTPVRVSGARVSANAFRILRVDPVIGRHFLDEEDQPGGPAAVLLSHGLWRDRYAADRNIVGSQIRVDDRPHTVVGVMPPRFRFPVEADLWIPLPPEGDWMKRESRWIVPFGRLAPGATRESAQNEMDLIAERLAREHPETNSGVVVKLLTGNEQFNGGEIEAMFVAMLGAVGFVMLIACANVASVQLTRAADRSREISIRTALGAGRWRIARQLLVESIVLASAAGVAGLAIAYVGVGWFDAVTIEERPYFVDFSFDLNVFAYLACICVGAGILFGLAPAVHALRTDVNSALKAGSRSQTSSRGARRFTSAMVIGEVALSVVLLSGAGLMLRSFWNVYNMDLGVRTESTLSGMVVLPEADYSEPAEQLALHDAVRAELETIPGAVSVCSASHLPGRGYSRTGVEIEGSPADDPEQRPREATVVVGSDYFTTLRAPLLQGRAFTPADTLDTERVAIVSQPFAAKYWPEGNAIGKRFRLGDEGERPWLTVVGVAPAIRQNSERDRDVRPVIYLPFRQQPTPSINWMVHTSVPPASAADAFRAAVARVDPDLPVQDLMSLEERLDSGRWAYSVFGGVFAVFASIALGLAAMGVFALVRDSVRRRIPEFGVRVAFGATSRDILRMVLSQAMRRVLIGLAIGVPLAYLAARMLEAILVGVNPSDPLTLVAVSLFLLAVSLAACWLPARRAAMIKPVVALRNE